MKHRPLCLFALIVFPFSLTPARAQNILYWSDLEMGTDRMAQALAALPITYSVTTATSDANFTTLISGGGFNMGILFIQGSAASGFTSPAALASFVGAGGRAIYAQWDGDNSFAAPFGATFTGNINNTTVSILSAALLPGVANPAALFNPGWGIAFSTGLTPNAGSTVAATFENGDAAIVLDSTGSVFFNGFLNDTFVTGSDGVNLYTNEVTGLFATVPEPTGLALGGLSLAVGGFVFWRYCKRKEREMLIG